MLRNSINRTSQWSFLVLLIEKSNWLNQEDFVLIFEIKNYLQGFVLIFIN